MAYTIDAGLDPALLGVAWLIGHWEGTGHGQDAGGEPFTYSCTVDFTENGSAYLHYIMQWFETDAAGTPTRPLGLETGFWRPGPDGGIEAIIAHPEGFAEIYVGRITGAKIELSTDVVARTVSADVAETGGHRLYGNVESDLLFTYDRGTTQAALQPYLWARLQRA